MTNEQRIQREINLANDEIELRERQIKELKKKIVEYEKRKIWLKKAIEKMKKTGKFVDTDIFF